MSVRSRIGWLSSRLAFSKSPNESPNRSLVATSIRCTLSQPERHVAVHIVLPRVVRATAHVFAPMSVPPFFCFPWSRYLRRPRMCAGAARPTKPTSTASAARVRWGRERLRARFTFIAHAYAPALRGLRLPLWPCTRPTSTASAACARRRRELYPPPRPPASAGAGGCGALRGDGKQTSSSQLPIVWNSYNFYYDESSESRGLQVEYDHRGMGIRPYSPTPRSPLFLYRIAANFGGLPTMCLDTYKQCWRVMLRKRDDPTCTYSRRPQFIRIRHPTPEAS